MDDRTFDKQTAQDWIQAVEISGKSFRDDSIYPAITNLILQNAPGKILDVGCGQGICSEKIDLKACRYTGVEPSPFLLDRAKQLYSKEDREFLQGSAYALPVPERSFKMVFSVLVWHLLSDLAKAASELSRVLTDDGRFLIITANPKSYSAWKNFYPDAKMTGKKLEGTMKLGESLSHDVLYLHTFEELKESFHDVGLIIEKTETFLPVKGSTDLELLISIQGKKSC